MVAPFLIGRNLGDPDALRVLFLKGAGDDEYAGKMYCSVEIALHRHRSARRKACPVSELIGGRVRDRIRLYGSAGMYMPPETVRRGGRRGRRTRIPRIQDAARRSGRKRICGPSGSCAKRRARHSIS